MRNFILGAVLLGAIGAFAWPQSYSAARDVPVRHATECTYTVNFLKKDPVTCKWKQILIADALKPRIKDGFFCYDTRLQNGKLFTWCFPAWQVADINWLPNPKK